MEDMSPDAVSYRVKGNADVLGLELPPLRFPSRNTDIFGLGQATGLKEQLIQKIQDYSLLLVSVGAVIGVVGTVPLKDTPWGPMAATAGGVILAAGLVPIILGAF